MLYKGIIIEIKDEYSIVVTNESEFLRIKNKENDECGMKTELGRTAWKCPSFLQYKTGIVIISSWTVLRK